MRATSKISRFIIIALAVLLSTSLYSQTASISGKTLSKGEPLSIVNIFLKGSQKGAISDNSGAYQIKSIPPGTYTIVASTIGYKNESKTIQLKDGDAITLDFNLLEDKSGLEEVVITGTMKEVTKSESPVPVEVYSAKFFKSNPVPAIFDGLQAVNGVRPQLNCSVCNTGDIHINGLEGPYTMILIDGMPIVSGLSSVYGLSGIPQSLVERIEIVKGPASTLYGSEAVGGLINIITKNPGNAPLFSADVFGTSWGEVNADIAAKFNAGDKAQSLLSINYMYLRFLS